MSTILDGIRRYDRAARHRYRETFERLADGQAPVAMMITCSDSRVVPNLILDAEPGELFVVRNIAALVPPHNAADSSTESAVAYAVDILGIRDILVCGHSSCGGMRALLDRGSLDKSIQQWLAHGASSLEAWRQSGSMDPSLSEVDQLSQACTLKQLDHLASYTSVQRKLERGDVHLSALWFDIGAARPLVYSPGLGRFERVHQMDESGIDLIAASCA